MRLVKNRFGPRNALLTSAELQALLATHSRRAVLRRGSVKIELIRHRYVEDVPVLVLHVKRWWTWHKERWTYQITCTHHQWDTGRETWRHGHWVRSDGKTSCRLGVRLDAILHSAKHAPSSVMPDNVIEMHKRGAYR